jgi:uncharacterized protein YjbI with pentapeptide repeats
MSQAIISDDPLYQLIRNRQIDAFNSQREASCDFSGFDFRGLDLRDIKAENINFSDCYFRSADLRGVDFRSCCFNGASIHAAHISGTYFPDNIDASELMLSLLHGTRMRPRST